MENIFHLIYQSCTGRPIYFPWGRGVGLVHRFPYTVLWEYSCVEKHFMKSYQGKFLKYSPLLAVLPHKRIDPPKASVIAAEMNVFVRFRRTCKLTYPKQSPYQSSKSYKSPIHQGMHNFPVIDLGHVYHN